MHDARIDAARLTIDALEPRHFVGSRECRRGLDRQVEPMSGARMPGADLPLPALHGNGARSARGLGEGRQHDLVRVGEAGLFPGQRAHPHALLDAGAAVLHHAVFERPGFLMRELKVQVGEVHRVRQHLAEHAVEATIVESARPQDEIAGERQWIVGWRRAHVRLSRSAAATKVRWWSAGKLSRTLASRARSTSASAQPRPRGTRCRMRPQKSTIMLSP
jgi:hypothetical protein